MRATASKLPEGPLYDAREVARHLGVDFKKLLGWSRKKAYPEIYLLDAHTARVRKSDHDAWWQSRSQSSIDEAHELFVEQLKAQGSQA
jgi:predicted ATP-grasp superfamily ATP-dependent carboligase